MNLVTVRMFTGQEGTVRWEAAAPGESGLAMVVRGPKGAVTALAFADAASLAVYRAEAERNLLAQGYRVYPLPERRGSDDRRYRSRRSDRRRQWRERNANCLEGPER